MRMPWRQAARVTVAAPPVACRPPDDIALAPAAAGDQLGHGELAPGAE